MNPEFEVHILNESGIAQVSIIADIFNETLNDLYNLLSDADSREFCIVKTKLEEACFFAKKAMAKELGNLKNENNLDTQ